MKENVKVDSSLVDKVRKRVKKTGQTIGGFFEMAAYESFSMTKFEAGYNSDAFRAYLDMRGIKWKPNGSFTTIFWDKPFDLGEEWGIYKYQNSPQYKPCAITDPTTREAMDLD